jgi:hypothetical protein
MSDILNRRRFLGASAAALAAARSVSARPAPPQQAGDAIRVGVIGPGGRGTAVMKECIEYGSRYNARVTAVCDIWKQRLEAADKLVSESYGTKTATYTRHEELLADKRSRPRSAASARATSRCSTSRPTPASIP